MRSHNKVQIELVDDGIIASWYEPFKRTVIPPARSSDPMAEAMVTMMPTILKNITGNDEDWDEDKRDRMQALNAIVARATEALHPKPREVWVLEEKRVAIKLEAEAILSMLKSAHHAKMKIKEITDSGEHITPPGVRGVAYPPGGGFGDYISQDDLATFA
jgi:hypothetical protein